MQYPFPLPGRGMKMNRVFNLAYLHGTTGISVILSTVHP